MKKKVIIFIWVLIFQSCSSAAGEDKIIFDQYGNYSSSTDIGLIFFKIEEQKITIKSDEYNREISKNTGYVLVKECDQKKVFPFINEMFKPLYKNVVIDIDPNVCIFTAISKGHRLYIVRTKSDKLNKVLEYSDIDPPAVYTIQLVK